MTDVFTGRGLACPALYGFISVDARYQPAAVFVQGNTFDGRASGLELVREQRLIAAGAGARANGGLHGPRFPAV